VFCLGAQVPVIVIALLLTEASTDAPAWLDTQAQAQPSRAARDLVVQRTTGLAGYAAALPVLLGWTAVFAVLAVLAYRRDEGRRFR
jgi:ABC-2 type transport system permease protein